jgi:microcystin-dependent protein
MEPLLGMITLFAGTFAPHGWSECRGQLLRIAENTALFAILGARYGGDGHATFALPNLEGYEPGSNPCRKKSKRPTLSRRP